MKKFSTILCAILLALAAAGLVACGDREKTPSVDEPSYTVTFDYNYDGAPEAVKQTVKRGDKASKPSDPARSGYTFGGWFLYGDRYEFGEVTSDITVEALWRDASAIVDPGTPKHSVYFEAAEGVSYDFGGTKPTTVTEGETLRFALKVSPYYVGTPVVKANGAALQKDKYGAYNAVVTQSMTVTVEGIERDTSRMAVVGDHFTIATPLQWIEFVRKCNEFPNYTNSRYELTADLDFCGEEIPMVEQFYGTLDGNGHTISDFTVTVREDIVGQPSEPTAVGLFSYVQGATISDLSLRDFRIGVVSNGVVRIGGIAGVAGSADFLGCNVSGKIEFQNTYGYYSYIGGIVGYATAIQEGISGAILSCNANVQIIGDPTSSTGGIVGCLVGGNVLMPASVAGCAVRGTLSGGTVGGIVGDMGAYAAVADCYFVGKMTADTSIYVDAVAAVGGIVGNCSYVESALQHCFASFEGTATAASPDDEKTGDIVATGGIPEEADLNPYIVYTILEDCYAVRGNLFIDDEDTRTEIESVDALLELLDWSADRWTSGDGIYPVATSYDDRAFAYSLLFTGHKIARANGGEPFDGALPLVDEKGNAKTKPYTPVSFLLGNDGVAVYEDAEHKGVLSNGFYAEDLTASDHIGTRLPAAYIVRNTDARVYIGFSDYTAIAKTYYFAVSDGENVERYALTLGSGDYFTASFAYGAFVETFSFVYDAQAGEVLFLGCPQSLGLAAVGAIAGDGIRLTTYTETSTLQFACFAQNEYVGTWYTNGATYEFDAALFGYIYEGDGKTLFTYGLSETGVTVRFDTSAVEFTKSGDTLVYNDVTLTKYDKFRGDYESLAYDRHTVTFDGAGNAYVDGAEEPTAYTLNDDGTQATVGEVVYTRDEYGTLSCMMDGVEYTFGGLYSFAGVWKVMPIDDTSEKHADYRLMLYGLDASGIGYAADSLGNTLVYTAIEMDATVALALTAQTEVFAYIMLLEDEGGYVPVFTQLDEDGNIELTLYLTLDDPFAGTWYDSAVVTSPSAHTETTAPGDTTEPDPTNPDPVEPDPVEPVTKPTFTFAYGYVLADGATEPVPYRYVGNSNHIVFTIGDVTYTATYVGENEITIAYGTTVATYIWRDEFAKYLLCGEDGSLLLFNGESALGNGLVSAKIGGESYELSYTVSGNVATVTKKSDKEGTLDREDTLFMTVTYDAESGFYTAVYDEQALPDASRKDTEVYGVYNGYTGHWSAYGGIAQKTGIVAVQFGILSEKSTGEAYVAFAEFAEPWVMQVSPWVEEGEVVGLTLTLDEVVYKVAPSGTRLSLDDGTRVIYLSATDDMAGTWQWLDSLTMEPIEGEGILFDGTAEIYLGAGNVDPSKVRLGAAYDAGSGTQLYYGWASLDETSVTPALYLDLNGTPRVYAYAMPATLSEITTNVEKFASFNPQIYHLVGTDRYMLVIYPFSDPLTGEMTTTNDGAVIDFMGNSLQNDVKVGWGFNYLTVSESNAMPNGLYMYEIVEVADGVATLYVYDAAKFGKTTFMPAYTLTLTLDEEENILSAAFEAYDDAYLFEDLWAA